MPDTALNQVLSDAVAEVLETMFFVTSEGAPPAEALGEPEILAELRFEGEPSGSFSIRITRSVAQSVAADFLGAEVPDVSEQQVLDVVREMANMICGSVLSRVESEATFRLSTPQVSEGEPESRRALSASAELAVEVRGGAMSVAIRTEQKTCQPAEELAS